MNIDVKPAPASAGMLLEPPLLARVGVIGAGQMGNGIAHTFALNGFPVTLIDVSTDALARARSTIAGNLDRQVKKGVIEAGAKEPALARITDATDVSAASEAALVIEAASEDPALKFRLFAALDEVVGPQTILATNTSSISITEIAGRTRRPQRVIGMHFMNPVPMMALVEVIRGLATSDATTATVTATPVHTAAPLRIASARFMCQTTNHAIGTRIREKMERAAKTSI